MISVVTAGILAAVIGIGSIRTATPEAHGTQAELARDSGNAASDGASNSVIPEVIRVGSFNIHAGRPAKGKENLDLTRKTMEGLDFVGLYEVIDPVWPGTPPQASELTSLKAGRWLFLPSERRYWSDRFGNAIVTGLPVRSWRRLPLPAGASGSRRSVSIIECGSGKRQITFLVTHISRSEDQQEQLEFVADLFLQTPAPVVLMGDLNVTSSNQVIAGLLKTPGVGNPLDEKKPADSGKHIDWILTRGLTMRDAGVRDLGASDHPLIWAELAIDAPTTSPTAAPESSPE